MNGLVNYSSEDEHDEPNYKVAGERGKYSKRRTPQRQEGGGCDDARRRQNNSGSGSGAVGGRNNYKDEDDVAHKYKSPSSSSLATHCSGSRETRDYREGREGREHKERHDSRDYNNGGRCDYKNERFNRSKEYSNNRDNRRDNTRRPRDDERNPRGGGGGGANYNNRYNSSSHHKERLNNNRFNDSESTSSSRRYQRGRDDRPDSRRSDNRYARKQRSPASRSPSPTSNAAHSKRHSNRNEDRHRRTRSRSSSHSRSASPVRKSPTFSNKPLEQARNTALDLERKLNPNGSSISSTTATETRQMQPRNTEAVLSLPLNDAAPKVPTVIALAPGACSGEPAVIQLPSYYNPSVINPNKYAEQVQKRKLIWGAKKAEDTSAKWGHAQFSQDSDGKVASKFMRLMGIKGGVAAPAAAAKSDVATAPATKPVTVTDVKSREKLFSSMEQQYEVARQVTHTMRGVGLGFSSRPI